MGQKFQVGEIVQLKSGGPRMTVEEVGSAVLGGDTVHCRWFAGAKLQDGHFIPESLERPKEDEEKEG